MLLSASELLTYDQMLRSEHRQIYELLPLGPDGQTGSVRFEVRLVGPIPKSPMAKAKAPAVQLPLSLEGRTFLKQPRAARARVWFDRMRAAVDAAP